MHGLVPRGRGLRRPLADGSYTAPLEGRDTAATVSPQHPQRPASGTRPPLTPLYSGCPDVWTETVGPVTDKDVGSLSAPSTPTPVLGPALRDSFPVAPPAAQFPGDCFPATAGEAVSARSPASGSRADRGRLWLRRRASQGGSGSSEAGGWLSWSPRLAAPRVGRIRPPGLSSRVPKTGTGTGLRGTTAFEYPENAGPLSA